VSLEAPAANSGASTFVLPWKISRVKKHRLDRMTPPPPPPSSSQTRHHHEASGDGADGAATAPLTTERRRASASSESLDSVVERILENAAADCERRRSSRRRGEKATRRGDNWGAERHDDQPSNDRPTARSSTEQPPLLNGVTSAAVNGGQERRQRRRRRREKTLEELFEEAVESVQQRDDDVDVDDLTARHGRVRSAENWERQIYDSELHDECRHYRLRAYSNRDVSRVLRGFVFVTSRDKTPSDVDTDELAPGDGACRRRLVVSAAAATPPLPGHDADGLDLGLDAELAANAQARAGGRRSSTATWDSVSVDSLLMYDDQHASLQAAATALYSGNTEQQQQQQQRDDELVDKLRRLHDQCDDSDAVWVPMSTLGDSSQPETDGAVTSLNDGAAVILSDCVTSQHVVISVKLPRRLRHARRRAAGEQRQPFRQLRLRREIRFVDDARAPSCHCAAVRDAPMTSSRRCVGDVSVTSRRGDADDDTSGKVRAADDGSVLLTAERLLNAAADDLSTSIADAEVEFDRRDSSRCVETVPPVCDSSAQRVDVRRSEATRVVRLAKTSSSRLHYVTPSLVQTVDSIRRALLQRRGATGDGVAVTCDAVETVERRGDLATPLTRRSIVVDCLPPPQSAAAV